MSLRQEANFRLVVGNLFDDMSCEIVRPEDFATTQLTATSPFKPTYVDMAA